MNKTLLTTLFAAASITVQAADRPNIILILADDLGYGDVGFHDSPIQTPNLDSLAKVGVRLENFYSCPVSSPTRAGTMTGRYPIRFGMQRSVIPPQRDYGVATTEVLIPEMLEQAGYEHRACFGKWHIGHNREEWLPINRGFNHYVGCYNGAVDYFTKMRDGEVDWHHGDESVDEPGYVTDLLGDHAAEYIASVPKDEPYFIYLPFTAPHSPLGAKQSDIDRYKHLETEGINPTYAAMVDCMDQNIGKVIKASHQRGDFDNTVIIFYSDNGGDKFSSNAPMRGGKFLTYEGGIRVAALAYWKNGGVTGGRIIDQQMGYIDMFPTIKALAYGDKHSEIADKNPLDGQNILPYIDGSERELQDRFWFSYIDQNPNKKELLGLNYGDLKLVVERPAADNNKQPQPKTRIELYKLNSKHSNEYEPIKDNEKEQMMLNKLEEYMSLRRDDQVDRYNIKVKGFKAPKGWKITNN